MRLPDSYRVVLRAADNLSVVRDGAAVHLPCVPSHHREAHALRSTLLCVEGLIVGADRPHSHRFLPGADHHGNVAEIWRRKRRQAHGGFVFERDQA